MTKSDGIWQKLTTFCHGTKYKSFFKNRMLIGFWCIFETYLDDIFGRDHKKLAFYSINCSFMRKMFSVKNHRISKRVRRKVKISKLNFNKKKKAFKNFSIVWIMFSSIFILILKFFIYFNLFLFCVKNYNCDKSLSWWQSRDNAEFCRSGYDV